MSSTSRALDTLELLEMILMLCSTKEITRARQVSSFFKNVIDSSKSLRKEMYLEPAVKLKDRIIKSTSPNSIDYVSPYQYLHPFFGFPKKDKQLPNEPGYGKVLGQKYHFRVQDLLSWERGLSWEKMLINRSPGDPIYVVYRFPRPSFGEDTLAAEATLGDLRNFLETACAQFDQKVVEAYLSIVDREFYDASDWSDED